MQGHVDASGANQGGLIEVSGKNNLAQVDLDKIEIGQGGQLLLDPKNIIISDHDDAYQWLMLSLLVSGYKDYDLVNVRDYYGIGRSVALSDNAKLMAIGSP